MRLSRDDADQRPLAIIPARGGSTRIPKKNIKDFLGVPIIGRVINALHESEVFSQVVVSTDSDEIAAVAESFGALAPQRRGEKSCSDSATLKEAIDETLTWFAEPPEWCACVLATSVLLRPERLREAIAVIKKEHVDSLLSVVRFGIPPEEAFTVDNDHRFGAWLSGAPTLRRTQDYRPAFHDAGQFYFFRPRELPGRTSLEDPRPWCFELPEVEAQDIDNYADWRMAEVKFLTWSDEQVSE